MMIKRQTLMTAAGLLFASVAHVAQAAPVVVNHEVAATDNLYYSDWGHWWTAEDDEALGAGTAASAVDWVFSSGDSVHLVASGWVISDGTLYTDAAGNYAPDSPCLPDCTFKDGNFRGLTVHSLIGIWSTSPDEIIPITEDPLSVTAPFFVGLESWLTVPEGFGELYLFLAQNDGYFADNSGSYQLSLTVTPIPLPAAAWFMLSGLAGLMGWRRMARSR